MIPRLTSDEQIEWYKRWLDLETRGEAICSSRALHTKDDAQRAKWNLLAELERSTKGAVLEYLRANGIVAVERAGERRAGEKVAEQTATEGWLELMAELRPRVVDYIEELHELVTKTTTSPQRMVALQLCEHEEAWLAFVDRELAGDSGSSLDPVRSHLNKWRDRASLPTGGPG